MKQFKKLLLIAVFMLGVGGVANAQKIGHIDTSKLVQNMPETKKANSELEKIQKTYKSDIEANIKAYQTKAQRYAAEEKTQTPETNSRRKAELQADATKIQQAEQIATQELRKKEIELKNPIYEKAQKAIKDVAAAQGLVYVFNSAPGGGLIIFEKGTDIYNAVKTKLGF
ncbi:MAG: OmpH family outer membrane protein [Polaribacter sp.]|jgi:outer membrane protein|nr:OmpH family outer membrane protein [Polaribacter sp.]MDG1528944.1 OmpH family outer membrane protein [Polaribacter sp.]MDG1953902.1 OmpH family outer membrane protein [Polaribacter sp.]MDG2073094.1 OmpH family outer membrane protein [Polaribacter sp.]